MKMKSEKIIQLTEVGNIDKILNYELNDTTNYKINIEGIQFANLSDFNTLLKFYVRQSRSGKKISYTNCNSHKVKSLINRTKFKNAFDFV